MTCDLEGRHGHVLDSVEYISSGFSLLNQGSFSQVKILFNKPVLLSSDYNLLKHSHRLNHQRIILYISHFINQK